MARVKIKTAHRHAFKAGEKDNIPADILAILESEAPAQPKLVKAKKKPVKKDKE